MPSKALMPAWSRSRDRHSPSESGTRFSSAAASAFMNNGVSTQSRRSPRGTGNEMPTCGWDIFGEKDGDDDARAAATAKYGATPDSAEEIGRLLGDDKPGIPVKGKQNGAGGRGESDEQRGG